MKSIFAVAMSLVIFCLSVLMAESDPKLPDHISPNVLSLLKEKYKTFTYPDWCAFKEEQDLLVILYREGYANSYDDNHDLLPGVEPAYFKTISYSVGMK